MRSRATGTGRHPAPVLLPRALRPRLPAGLALVVAGCALATPGAALERSLRPIERDLVLDGGAFEQALTIEVPAGEPVTRAILALGFDNALAAAPDGSRVTLVLNGRELAVLPATASQAPLAVEVQIPGHLMTVGTNRLVVRGELRHRLGCTRASSDELWFRLRAQETSLRLTTASGGGLGPRDLDGFLRASFFDGEPFAIASTRPADDRSMLAWGARIAEAVALRRAPRSLAIEDARFDLAGAPDPAQVMAQLHGRNVALVGTMQEVRPLLDALGFGPGTPPAFGRLPHDPAHAYLLLAGGDDAEVAAAVRLLHAGPVTADPAPWGGATADPAGWGGATADLFGVGGVGGVAGGGRPALVATGEARAVSLRELGYATRETPLTFTGSLDVEVDLSPTLYAGNGQKLDLALSYAYAPGLAPTSALLLLINGAPWNLLRLDDPDGDLVDRHLVHLPLGLFRPGRNKVGFQPVLEPAEGSTCPPGGSPAFSLFEDSELRLPTTASLVTQPDLRRFADSGMPFAGEQAGEAEIVVTSPDADTISATWTLLGKLAQQRDAGLGQPALSFAPTSLDHNLLVVGPLDRLPPALRQAGFAAVARVGESDPSARPPAPRALSPAARGEVGDRARDVWAGRLQERPRQGDLPGLLQRLKGLIPVAQADEDPRREAMAVDDGRPRDAALAGFRSPLRERKAVVLVTASTPPLLREAVTRLVAPTTWSEIEGSAVFWNRDGGGLVVQRPAEQFRIGALPRDPGALLLIGRTYLSLHVGWWLAVCFGSLAILGLVTRRAIGRRLETRR